VTGNDALFAGLLKKKAVSLKLKGGFQGSFAVYNKHSVNLLAPEFYI